MKPWEARKAKIDSDTAAYCENRRLELEQSERFYMARMFARLFGGARV